LEETLMPIHKPPSGGFCFIRIDNCALQKPLENHMQIQQSPAATGFRGVRPAIWSIGSVICFSGCKLRSFQARLDSRNPLNGQAVSRKVL
jgi:hypothetical protein